MTTRVCLCHGAPCGECKREDALYCSISKRRIESWRVVPVARVQPVRSYRTADYPQRKKRCTGPCGRSLPATDFYSNGAGYPIGKCKDCRRAAQRRQVRQRYQTDPAFRAAKLARDRARHASDPERFRAERRARYRKAHAA